jgi:hypothetical protein
MMKIDEERRLIYGRATEEVPDRADEIFDYDSSKPYFQAWSASVHKDSGGKSFGNLRSMHSSIAAGRLEEITFLDKDKAIDIVAKVVDDAEWKKVQEGVYTGFSVGGKYENKWNDTVGKKAVKRFTASPAEISLVDRPCCPTARFFDVIKSDGSVAQKEFQAPTEATSGIASYDQEGGKRRRRKAVSKTLGERVTLKKGMGSVAYLAALIRDLEMFFQNQKNEAVAEGDNSTIPPKIREVIQTLSRIMGEMATEEAGELSDTEPSIDYNWLPYRAAADAGELRKSLAGMLGLQKFDGLSEEEISTIQSVHDTACNMGASCVHKAASAAATEEEDMAQVNKSVIAAAVIAALEATGVVAKGDSLAAEGGKRGTGVKSGVEGMESHNAEDSPEGGKTGATTRASNKADGDWSDEDMDKACEGDDDMEWEEKRAKKAASQKKWDKWEKKRATMKAKKASMAEENNMDETKSKKFLEGDELKKAVAGAVVETLQAIGIIPSAEEIQKFQQTGVDAALEKRAQQRPVLTVVDKDAGAGEGPVQKAASSDALLKSVEPIYGGSNLENSKVNDAATLIKAVHAQGGRRVL